MKRKGIPVAAWITVLILSASFGLWAGEGDLTIPVQHLVKLTLKTLTYDRALKTWEEDPIRIGIVASGERVDLGKKILKVFAELSKEEFLVAGHTFYAELISDPGSEDQTYLAYIVLDTSPERLAGITDAARRDHILTITPYASAVDPVSIAFALKGDKITIYACIECLKAEHVQLGAQFLKITKRREK